MAKLQKFRVLERSFIDTKLVEPGEIVTIDTAKVKPGKALEKVGDDEQSPDKRGIPGHNVPPNGPAATPASPLPVDALA